MQVGGNEHVAEWQKDLFSAQNTQVRSSISQHVKLWTYEMIDNTLKSGSPMLLSFQVSSPASQALSGQI